MPCRLLCATLFVVSCATGGSLRENAGDAFHRKDYPEAVALYTMMIDNGPTAEAFVNRGAAYQSLGDMDKAAADYRQALILDPHNAKALNNLGALFYVRKEYRKAMAQFDQAIESNPDYLPAYINRGFIHEAMGEPALACDDFRMAGLLFHREMRPEIRVPATGPPADSLEARLSEANRLYLEGNYEGAVTLLGKLLETHPDARVYTNRGAAYYQLGRLDEAESDLLTAIRMNPDSVRAHNNLGAVLFQKGNTRAALDAYEKALDIDPENPAAKTNYLALADHLESLQMNPEPTETTKAAPSSSPAPNPEPATPVTPSTEEQAPPPAGQPTSISQTEGSENGGASFAIHVESYRSMASAREAAEELKSLGEPVSIHAVDLPRKGRWYRIYVGRYATRSEATHAGETLENEGKIDYFAVKSLPRQIGGGDSPPPIKTINPITMEK